MEEWRDVLGYEGYYQASSEGRIRSLDRYCYYVNGRVDFIKGQIKSQRPRKDGYMQVNLCRDSKKVCLAVHQVIWEAFKGKRTKGMHICHNNSQCQDNRIENLREDTCAGNFRDKIENGTSPRGENQGSHKLTAEQILAIRADPRQQKTIAKEYGIRQGHVSRIKRRAAWAHI